MENQKTRKPEFITNYYTDDDYEDIKEKLPLIIKEVEKRAGEFLEPTIYEKRKVMEDIKDFIRKKHRKVYGGTALNEAIKLENPDDAIYDEHHFGDIEFYSPTPVPDLVELCNMLYEKGYKYVNGAEAQHEETYTIFVNFQIYCDISYVPVRVYNGIRTIQIDGIDYVHPHFALIDYLRMINQPLTAASQRWMKAFERMYKLLKNYPLEKYDKPLKLNKPTSEMQSYLATIKKEFMLIPEVQQSCMISGFEAYNFFIRHAMNDRTVEQQARTSYGENRLKEYLANVPNLEFVSVNYRDTVERLYDFIRKIVKDPSLVTMDEYFPLFQFTDFSVSVNYNGVPLATVYRADGFCVPNIKTTAKYMYVSYQYLLMTLLIHKFRSHLDKNQQMYFNYGIAVSNLVNVRNIYLTHKNLGVINDTVFGEFKIQCTGTTVSYFREGRIRNLKRREMGKTIFSYTPEKFFKQTDEAQAKFDPTKHLFKNTSGNRIMNPKNLLFSFDAEGNIKSDTESETDYESSSASDESDIGTNATGGANEMPENRNI